MTTTRSKPWTAVLDTSVLVDLTRGQPEALEYLLSTPRSSFVLSTVTLLEMRAPRQHEPKAIKATEDVVSGFESISPNQHDWSRAVNLYLDRYKKRQPRPKLTDLLIAETARGLGLPVVTLDQVDFALIPGIDVIVPYRTEALDPG